MNNYILGIVYASDVSEEFELTIPIPEPKAINRVYFSDNPKVYIAKILKDDVSLKGKLKKNDRVFNSRHCCIFCSKMVIRISEHLRDIHSKEQQIKDAIQQETDGEKRKVFDLLRNKGDRKNNLRVLQDKQGELIVSRRVHKTADLKTSDFKPCPSCYLWVRNLAKHRTYTERCKMKDSKVSKSKATIMANSLLEGESASNGPSEMLKSEVISKFIQGEVSDVAKGDPLILKIGEHTLKKNAKNALKRGRYASDRMRMAARVLIKIRENHQSTESWDEVLKPSNFKVIVNAVSRVAGLTEKNDSYEHPSNALKSGHIIKELSCHKESMALMGNPKDEKKAQEACDLIKVLEKNWSAEVSSMATATLAEAKFNITNSLPTPKDIKLLSDYIQAQAHMLSSVNSLKTKEGFHKGVEIAQTRLLSYNKRRPGEIDSIRLVFGNLVLSLTIKFTINSISI